MHTDLFPVLVIATVFGFLVLRAKLWLSRAERCENQERKFGAAGDYIRVTVLYEGKPVRLLMTQHELAMASDRAERQPEEFEDQPDP